MFSARALHICEKKKKIVFDIHACVETMFLVILKKEKENKEKHINIFIIDRLVHVLYI